MLADLIKDREYVWLIVLFNCPFSSAFWKLAFCVLEIWHVRCYTTCEKTKSSACSFFPVSLPGIRNVSRTCSLRRSSLNFLLTFISSVISVYPRGPVPGRKLQCIRLTHPVKSGGRKLASGAGERSADFQLTASSPPVYKARRRAPANYESITGSPARDPQSYCRSRRF